MAVSDLFARFYTKVFIGLYAVESELHVGVMSLTSRGEVTTREHRFPDRLDETFLSALQEYVSISPYNYIAIVSESEACGALPTCSLSKAKEMAPIVDRSKTICIDEEWMNYCGEEVLFALQERFGALEPDAIYSPFALLHAGFETEMAGGHTLYLLLTPGGMSLAVVKESHLRFAEQFPSALQSVAQKVEKITSVLEGYYGKPCCRGEFIESVRIADGTGNGEPLASALEETLLVEAYVRRVDTALLCAQTCMKEHGYAL